MIGDQLLMNEKSREAVQRWLAIIVIIAMLVALRIHPSVIIFFSIVIYFVWRAVQRSEQQGTERIFEFYREANEVLRDEERRWYGFEIAEVIRHGEDVLLGMNDAPPLVRFTLGALYHRIGNYAAATEHLSYVLEDELGDERRRFDPSPELSRYVVALRRFEREPSEAPPTMAALRSLDRARRARAQALLDESREHLKVISQELAKPSRKAALAEATMQEGASHEQSIATPHRPMPQPRPPIAEVLRDLYEEEKRTA